MLKDEVKIKKYYSDQALKKALMRLRTIRIGKNSKINAERQEIFNSMAILQDFCMKFHAKSRIMIKLFVWLKKKLKSQNKIEHTI